MIGSEPPQDPLVAVSVCPSRAAPEIVGIAAATGGVAAVAAPAVPSPQNAADRVAATSSVRRVISIPPLDRPAARPRIARAPIAPTKGGRISGTSTTAFHSPLSGYEYRPASTARTLIATMARRAMRSQWSESGVIVRPGSSAAGS